MELGYLEASSIGARHYQGNPCVRGHSGLRYTKGRSCVECVQEARGNSRGVRKRAAGSLLVALAAMSEGATTYVSKRPCKAGHTIRFVASNNCVECDRLTAERHKIARKINRIQREYRLPKADYLAMVKAQGSQCKICARAEEDHFKLHVDHCHATGKVRGLLCGPCNQGLGMFRSNGALMRVAAAYLDKDGEE